MNKRSKFIGSLVGTAIGDSLGANREGAADIYEETELGSRYTDDTAMMIGVAESFSECNGFDYWDMTQRFIRNYEREPWRRYGGGPPRIFRKMRNGKSGFGMLDREIYPGGSYGNGGAMRVAPVGLLHYDDPRTLREIAYHSTAITHSNELALEGAAVQACAVALAVLAGPVDVKPLEFLGALKMFTRHEAYAEKLKIIVNLLQKETGKAEVVERLGNGVEAINSVPTAIYSFLANPDFESAVIYAVSLGGDTDTIGAMTGAIAGACYGIETIPPRWLEKLENRVSIENLGRKLWEVKSELITA